MTTALAPSNGVAGAPKRSPLYQLANRFNIEPNKLMEVLTGTVIKPTKDGREATLEEIAAFCIVADQYGLNPFTREIHAFADKYKGVVPIVGVDGWAKIVNSHPQFDGCDFTETADENGRPISIKCAMYVKGRTHPVAVTERYVECKRDTDPWRSMPWRMLRHKSYMQAARVAFSISGLYDEDEARDIIHNESQPSATVASAPVKEISERFAPIDVPAAPSTPAQPAAAVQQVEPAQGSVAEDKQGEAAEVKVPAVPEFPTWQSFVDWMGHMAGEIEQGAFEAAMGKLKLAGFAGARRKDAEMRKSIAMAVVAGKFDWDAANIVE